MIRIAKPTDLAAIRACAEQAYAPYVARIGRKPAPMLADYAGPVASGLVNVATDEAGTVQGFIVFFPQGLHMLLENVAVMPDAAGRGIGRSLIGLCEDAARRRGFAAVRLYTNAKMSENLSVYPRLGYDELERRIEDGFDRVYFEKRLT